MKICGKCDQAIMVGERFSSHDKLSTSAGGITVFRHIECPPAPPKTSAVGRRLARLQRG